MIYSIKSFLMKSKYIISMLLSLSILHAISSVRFIKLVAHDLPDRKPCCSGLIKSRVFINSSSCTISYLTYVTYVELRQNLTGSSAIPTTPKRGIASLDSPGQQRVGIWRTASPDRRHIREGQQELGELIFEVLETLDVVLAPLFWISGRLVR